MLELILDGRDVYQTCGETPLSPSVGAVASLREAVDQNFFPQEFLANGLAGYHTRLKGDRNAAPPVPNYIPRAFLSIPRYSSNGA